MLFADTFQKCNGTPPSHTFPSHVWGDLTSGWFGFCNFLQIHVAQANVSSLTCQPGQPTYGR